MDPSVPVGAQAPAAQDVQKQVPADQPVIDPAVAQSAPQNSGSNTDDQSQDTPAQQVPGAQPKPSQQKTQQISVSGSGGLEAGSAIIQEDADDEDDEDELQVAPQEKKNLGVMGQGGEDEQGDEQQIVSQPTVVDVGEEAVEIQPTVPEVVAGSPEVEKLVEITETEKPKISDELKNIGVTHSGPGVIDAATAHLSTPKMPITYEQVLSEEEKIKSNRLHSSKYWLLEKIKYLWRKVNPNITMTVKKKIVKKIAPVKALPVKAEQVAPVKVQVTEKAA